MELILKKDVPYLGFRDDVVTVKNGYGRNYLIPQGYAVLATASAKKQHEETLRQRTHKEKKIVEDAKKTADAIKGLDLKITAKTAAGADKIFGSVNPISIAETLRGKGITIDKKFITISGGNIKRLGKYNASIRLHREVMITIDFEVVAEKK